MTRCRFQHIALSFNYLNICKQLILRQAQESKRDKELDCRYYKIDLCPACCICSHETALERDR